MPPLEAVPNYVGGVWLGASGGVVRPLEDPASGRVIGEVVRSGPEDVERAAEIAWQAFASWRRVPAAQRLRVLARFRDLVEDHAEPLARAAVLGRGGTLDAARADVRRGLDALEAACAAPDGSAGAAFEDAAAGVDREVLRRPVGVFAGLTSAASPLGASLALWPHAVAAGNTFVLKPSAGAALAQQLVFELVHQAGLPAGVVNLLHGDRATGAALVGHRRVRGVSVVGDAAAAAAVHRLVAGQGKRIQAFAHARHHLVVLPDADLDRAVPAIVDLATGGAPAGSVLHAVGSTGDELVERVVDAAARLVVGDGLDPAVGLGALASGEALDRAATLVHLALAGGGRLALDGRRAAAGRRGHLLGACVVEIAAGAAPLEHELAAPVLLVTRPADLDEAIGLLDGAGGPSVASLFTASGRAARRLRHEGGAAAVAINLGLPVPLVSFPCGGGGGSFFGDREAQRREAIEFYGEARLVVSRWS